VLDKCVQGPKVIRFLASTNVRGIWSLGLWPRDVFKSQRLPSYLRWLHPHL
jgi:hypothetical protein